MSNRTASSPGSTPSSAASPSRPLSPPIEEDQRHSPLLEDNNEWNQNQTEQLPPFSFVSDEELLDSLLLFRENNKTEEDHLRIHTSTSRSSSLSTLDPTTTSLFQPDDTEFFDPTTVFDLPTPTAENQNAQEEDPSPDSLLLDFQHFNLNQEDYYSHDEDDNQTIPSYLYCQPCIDPADEAALIQTLLQGMSLSQQPTTTTSSTTTNSLAKAQPLVQAFTASKQQQPRVCYGHKERILGCHISPDNRFLATASQDSTVRVWKLDTHKMVANINHPPFDPNYEVLRVAWASSSWGQDNHQTGGVLLRKTYPYLLVTGGADGNVKLWGATDTECYNWTCLCELDHASFSHFVAQDANDRPQTYALQFIDEYSALGQEANHFLLTSSDDHIHLWEMSHKRARTKVQDENTEESSSSSLTIKLREVMSICFEDMHKEGFGVKLTHVTDDAVVAGLPHSKRNNEPSKSSSEAFGGARNPMGLVYVFDAHYCPVNGLLGAALSDGSLRLMNGRGVCVCLLTLPGHQSHLTAFSWDTSGHKLCTCVATGQVITWSIDTMTTTSSTEGSSFSQDYLSDCSARVCAVYDGGHELGRPLFGACFWETYLLSWGVDGRLCLWDAKASGDVLHGPLAILREDESYPLYAVQVSAPIITDDDDSNSRTKRSFIAVAGGGNEGGFLGIPVYVYDILEENKMAPPSPAATTDSGKGKSA